MARKRPPNIYCRKYVTKGGYQQERFYVQFVDWKGIRRTVPVGENLTVAKEKRNELLAKNTIKYDFDHDRPGTDHHIRRTLTAALGASTAFFRVSLSRWVAVRVAKRVAVEL